MRKRASKWILLALVGLGILGWIVYPWSTRPVVLGDAAPSFVLRRLPSGKLSLHDFRGKVVVLNFWATWCPPCIDETPSLEQFASRMRDRGVVILGVSVDQNREALERFVKVFHLTYPIARDPERALSHRYGTYKYPETYIIDRSGHVAEKIIGATNWVDPRMIAFVQALADGGTTGSEPLRAPSGAAAARWK